MLYENCLQGLWCALFKHVHTVFLKAIASVTAKRTTWCRTPFTHNGSCNIQCVRYGPLCPQDVLDKPFVKVSYTEAIDILKKSGKKFEFPVDWGLDLSVGGFMRLLRRYNIVAIFAVCSFLAAV